MLKAVLKVIGFLMSMIVILVAGNLMANLSARLLAPHLSERVHFDFRQEFYYFDGATSYFALGIGGAAFLVLTIASLWFFGVFSKSRSNLAGRILAPVCAVLLAPIAFALIAFGAMAHCPPPEINFENGAEDFDMGKLTSAIEACEKAHGLR